MEHKQQLIEKLKGATNILVTVSRNPSVDQLAACIGLTLMLNNIGKRATAVFSGAIPPTIDFLKPADTIEKTTDSLRDFIISLDKAKADKLRYKVEDDVVRIFITPYRTSLSDKDLVFSQGDFNIDVIVALGVSNQQDLDSAITAHGRILHDATTVTIHHGDGGDLGSLNWQDDTASSLSEQVAALAKDFDKLKIDQQIATALLTGIVAETHRFSNDKTTAQTMTIGATLIAAGADQQLVASELDKTQDVTELPAPAPSEEFDFSKSEEPAENDESAVPMNEEGTMELALPTSDEPPVAPTTLEELTAEENSTNDTPAGESQTSENETMPGEEPEPTLPPVINTFSHQTVIDPPQTDEVTYESKGSLNNLEDTLRSQESDNTDLASARDAVEAANAESVNQPLEPIVALNAAPLGDPLNPPVVPASDSPTVVEAAHEEVTGQPGFPPELFEGPQQPMLDMPLPTPPPLNPPAADAAPDLPSTAPPLPPPLLPPLPPKQ